MIPCLDNCGVGIIFTEIWHPNLKDIESEVNLERGGKIT
jgi:hypothetical protein